MEEKKIKIGEDELTVRITDDGFVSIKTIDLVKHLGINHDGHDKNPCHVDFDEHMIGLDRIFDVLGYVKLNKAMDFIKQLAFSGLVKRVPGLITSGRFLIYDILILMAAMDEKIVEQSKELGRLRNALVDKKDVGDIFFEKLFSDGRTKCYTTPYLALFYGMYEDDFLERLISYGVLERRGNCSLCLGANYVGSGIAEERGTARYPGDLVWTKKGAMLIYFMFKEKGINPVRL